MEHPSNRRIVTAEILFGLLLWLSQVGLPVLGIQREFWFGLVVWVIFFVVGSHLIWMLSVRLPAPWRLFFVLSFAVLLSACVYPGLSRQYRKEHGAVAAFVPPYPPLSRGITVLSRSEIARRINSLPPLQREGAARDYRGLRVEWRCEFVGGHEREVNSFSLFLDCRDQPNDASALVSAIVAGSPGTKLLKEGDALIVTGTITGGPDLSVIRLDPASYLLVGPKK